MNAQELFHILGSVAFGLVVLLLVVLILAVLAIKKQITKVTTRISAVSSEIEGMVHTGRQYTQTVGKGFLGTLVFRIIKAFLKRK